MITAYRAALRAAHVNGKTDIHITMKELKAREIWVIFYFLFACPNPGVTGCLYFSVQALLTASVKTNLLKSTWTFPKVSVKAAKWQKCYYFWFANSVPACFPFPLLFSRCNNTVCLSKLSFARCSGIDTISWIQSTANEWDPSKTVGDKEFINYHIAREKKRLLIV